MTDFVGNTTQYNNSVSIVSPLSAYFVIIASPSAPRSTPGRGEVVSTSEAQPAPNPGGAVTSLVLSVTVVSAVHLPCDPVGQPLPLTGVRSRNDYG